MTLRNEILLNTLSDKLKFDQEFGTEKNSMDKELLKRIDK